MVCEAALEIEIRQYFSSEEILDAQPTGARVYAGMGTVPAVMGNLHNNVVAIATGVDESAANGVVVHANSPIAAVRGWNKEYPEVLGSPDTVRGKTFLVSDLSSAHYALSSWLRVLGLQDSDVIIRDMMQGLVVASFENHIGDGVALWAPQLYLALNTGWRPCCNPDQPRQGQPHCLVPPRHGQDQTCMQVQLHQTATE